MSLFLSQFDKRSAWPLVLLLGVLLVILATVSGGTAALTGVAMIAIGGLGELSRRKSSPNRSLLLAAHCSLYGAMYMLFFGARLHLAGSPYLLLADVIGSGIVIGLLAQRLPLSHTY